MALLDFLKNKKEKDKAKEKKAAKPVQTGKASVAKGTDKELNEVKVVKEPKTAVSNTEGSFSYNVIKEPHISEKGTILSEKNVYVFKIYNNTNKPEIKKAVEGIYGVDVLKVNVVTIPHKKRRLGRTEGYKKAYRKAIVTIKEGQKIEIF